MRLQTPGSADGLPSCLYQRNLSPQREHVFKNAPTGVLKSRDPQSGRVPSICAAIMNKYNVDTVPHLICGGQRERNQKRPAQPARIPRIDNVLVLRGDAAKRNRLRTRTGGHKYASDLLKQVVNMNAGVYLEEDHRKPPPRPPSASGWPGYPEKTFRSPEYGYGPQYLKKKIELGADYIVTDVFDNAKFYAFVKACREAGIEVPIIPGLKPIYSRKQLTVLPKTFHIDRDELSMKFSKPNRMRKWQVGQEWLLHQSAI